MNHLVAHASCPYNTPALIQDYSPPVQRVGCLKNKGSLRDSGTLGKNPLQGPRITATPCYAHSVPISCHWGSRKGWPSPHIWWTGAAAATRSQLPNLQDCGCKQLLLPNQLPPLPGVGFGGSPPNIEPGAAALVAHQLRPPQSRTTCYEITLFPCWQRFGRWSSQWQPQDYGTRCPPGTFWPSLFNLQKVSWTNADFIPPVTSHLMAVFLALLILLFAMF